MPIAFINPGSGPVRGATLENAAANIQAFVRDLEISGVEFAHESARYEEDDGRFSFALTHAGRRCLVDMPGLPLDQVRYLGEPQDILEFPRLYVDGHSVVWKYAIESVRDGLRGENAPNGGAPNG